MNNENNDITTTDDSKVYDSRTESLLSDLRHCSTSNLADLSMNSKLRILESVKKQDIDRISVTTVRPKQHSTIYIKEPNEDIKPLPFLLETSSAERECLFLNKLDLCMKMFDFNDQNKQLKSKEIKRITLIELADYIVLNSNSLTEPIYQGIINVFKTNVFRTIVPSSPFNEYVDLGENDEDLEFNVEQSWPHLQLVYDLFLRFISSPDFQANLGRKLIDSEFLSNLLDLFNSEDSRERDYVKMILHRIYGKLIGLRPFIRKKINHVFLRYVYEPNNMNYGIAELLEILGSIINGFQVPLKEEHKFFMRKVLLPLHKATGLNRYHAQLIYCLTEFIRKDANLLKTIVMEGILKFWPITNSSKEILFLNELEACFECGGPLEFQSLIEPVFTRIASCIESLHFQVCERVLLYWNNDYLLSLMTENMETILPIIYPSINKAQGHWNKTVHTLIMNVINWVLENNQKLLDQCAVKFTDIECRHADRYRKIQSTWAKLEDIANNLRCSFKNNAGTNPAANKLTNTTRINDPSLVRCSDSQNLSSSLSSPNTRPSTKLYNAKYSTKDNSDVHDNVESKEIQNNKIGMENRLSNSTMNSFHLNRNITESSSINTIAEGSTSLITQNSLPSLTMNESATNTKTKSQPNKSTLTPNKKSSNNDPPAVRSKQNPDVAQKQSSKKSDSLSNSSIRTGSNNKSTTSNSTLTTSKSKILTTPTSSVSATPVTAPASAPTVNRLTRQNRHESSKNDPN